MGSIIKADLQRIDTALKANLGHRRSLACLRVGSLDAWCDCATSLTNFLSLTYSVFADPRGIGVAASTWVHWRKSSTSKQLLSLLQTVIEEVHVAEPRAAGGSRILSALSCILITDFFLIRTQSATLWPAMRGWLLDQGGAEGIWTALAWCLTSGAHTATHNPIEVRNSIHAALELTADLLRGANNATPSLSQHPSVASVLTLLLSDILPRDFAAGNAHLWRLRAVLSDIGCIVRCACSDPATAARNGGGGSLASQLHQPLLVAWPCLIAALRQSKQQPSLRNVEADVKECCTFLLGFLIALRNERGTSLRPYRARHCACAIDIFELLVTPCVHAPTSASAATGTPLDVSVTGRLAGFSPILAELLAPKCLLGFAGAGEDPSDLLPARQLWGLVGRCERVIRDISPHCFSARMLWGEALPLLESISLLSTQSKLALVKKIGAVPPLVEAAFGRLLLSSAASALKASRMPGMEPAVRGFLLTAAGALNLRNPMTASAPAVTALILPKITAAVAVCCGPTALTEAASALAEITDDRFLPGLDGEPLLRVLSCCHVYALVLQTVACMLRPSQVMWEVAHTPTNVLSYHARSIAGLIVHIATSAAFGFEGFPANAALATGPLPETPAPLRERLAPPLLQLLHSPLLDLLAVMQHVPVEARADIRQWQSRPTSIPPVHTLPASMDPDAADAEVAMQGRVLTITLHSILKALALMGGGLEQLIEQSDQPFLVTRTGHLRVMWEANCSCRAAGYPLEGSGVEGVIKALSDGSTCSGLPSPIDVPTRSQAAARESAAEVLASFRRIAAQVWPHLAAAAATAGCGSSGVDAYADWEVLQAELLESAPGGLPTLCGEALWCFNPTCTNLEGSSELALKTHACGGGCGVRYCSRECQAQGWRDGHRLSCGRLRDRRAASTAAEG